MRFGKKVYKTASKKQPRQILTPKRIPNVKDRIQQEVKSAKAARENSRKPMR